MLEVPEALRAELKKPLGELMGMDAFISEYGKSRIISVGDIVTLSLLEKGIRPFLAAYDFRSMRHDIEKRMRERIKGAYSTYSTARNPPGTITEELEAAAASMAGKGGALYVEGEEDLAALVFMRISPEGCVIVYGQPDEGVVAVECNEKSRRKAELILGKMKK